MGKEFKKAFTLSEVLITLGIIGVIAAMTIPGLVQEIQDAQFKTAWKNAYADLNGATKRIMLDNGGNMVGIAFTQDTLRDKYLGYLNYTKKCNALEDLGNCWHKDYKYLNGAGSTWNDISFSRAILNNSSLMFWSNTNTNCNYTASNTPPDGVCGEFRIDINGFAGPNTIGKDIFGGWIQKYGIKPYGTQGDSNQPATSCIKTGKGQGCSALYLYQ